MYLLKHNLKCFFGFFYDVEFNSSFQLLYRLLFQEEYQVKYWFVYLQISHESKLPFFKYDINSIIKNKRVHQIYFCPPYYKTVWSVHYSKLNHITFTPYNLIYQSIFKHLEKSSTENIHTNYKYLTRRQKCVSTSYINISIKYLVWSAKLNFSL